MPKYVGKKLRDVKVGSAKYSSTQISKTNKTPLNHQDVQDLLTGMRAKAVQKNKMIKIPLIRVLAGTGWHSYKSQEDFDNYFEGRVNDAGKFHTFFQVEIDTLTSDFI
jgi:hypothetical protein